MSPGVGRPDLKLQQAGVHLKKLKQAIDTYRYDGSFHVEQARREDANAIDFTLRVSAPPPIDEWCRGAKLNPTRSATLSRCTSYSAS